MMAGPSDPAAFSPTEVVAPGRPPALCEAVLQQRQSPRRYLEAVCRPHSCSEAASTFPKAGWLTYTSPT